MITLKEGRIWFYVKDVGSELPTLDFELISAYVCPECKSILSAYFVGTITEEVLEFYQKDISRRYEVGTTKGGSYILQANHGADTYKDGKNCIYQTASGRGVENSLKTLCGLGSLCNAEMLNHFVKEIETGETKDSGLLIATDICEVDAPILLFNVDKICSGNYKYTFEKEEHLGEEIKNLIESRYKNTHRPKHVSSAPSTPKSYNIPEYTHLGSKKKIKLARTQATLF